jgi:hypothetical protein
MKMSEDAAELFTMVLETVETAEVYLKRAQCYND